MVGKNLSVSRYKYGHSSKTITSKPSRTYNRFAPLNDIPMDEPEVSHTAAAESKEPRPPPIILHEQYGMAKVIELCGEDYSFKKTSIGIKVFSPSKAKYEEIKKKLDDKMLCFHTHRTRDRGVFKMIISGLPKWPAKIIEESLEKQGVAFESVEEVITKRTTPDDSIYLVKFKRSNASKKMLHEKVRYINNVAITWKNSYSKKNGPTQCTRCAMYGHGAENCYRIKVCRRCTSDQHTTEECQIDLYKCGNCISKKYVQTNHRADDPRCPCREDYLLARNRALNKNRQQSRRQASYDFAEKDFPLPPRTNRTDERHLPKWNDRPSYADQVRAAPSTSKDMFSIDELFSIFQKATADLQNCSNKLEQLNVIMGLLKYAV